MRALGVLLVSSVMVAGLQPAASAVDLAGFRTQLQNAGVESAIDGILDIFLEETPARVETLCGELLHGTGAAVSSAAHALKGSVAAIGAGALAAMLGKIELTAKSDELADRDRLAQEVRSGATAVMAEVRGYRAHTP